MAVPGTGTDKVARLFFGVAQRPEVASLEPVWAETNREPGLIFLRQGEIISTMVFHIEEGKIRSIFVTSNPEKLAEFAKQPGRDVTKARHLCRRQRSAGLRPTAFRRAAAGEERAGPDDVQTTEHQNLF